MSQLLLETSKFRVIHETFVRSADENYITARWCAQSGQHTDFAWLAVHALEKYMKAALLANGKSAKDHGHDIVKWHAELDKVCGRDLLSVDLISGTATHTPLAVTAYLTDMYAVGNSNARYGIFGSSISWHDLQNLDAMVFVVRRLICPLDEEVDGARTDALEVDVPTYRDWLIAHPGEIIGHRHGGHLGNVIDREDHPLKATTLNCNLVLASKEYKHDWSWRQSDWHESVIDREILGPLQSADVATAKLAIDLQDWLLENVKIPHVNAINSAVSAAKIKHNLL